MQNSVYSFIIVILLLCCTTSIIIEGTCGCTCSRSPDPRIIGYSRSHEELYQFMWQSPSCSCITQYQIQFVGNCSTARPITVLTGNIRTSASIVIPQCSDRGCYFRVCAELLDGSFSSYSPCVHIDNQLPENRQYIELYHSVCVSIQGICGQGVLPGFFINGRLILWPQPAAEDGHNVTYHHVSRKYKFCFSNVTEAIILTEYCHQVHTSGCKICSADSGEIRFLSYSEIHITNSSNEFTVNPFSSSSNEFTVKPFSSSRLRIHSSITSFMISDHDHILPSQDEALTVAVTVIIVCGVMCLLIGVGLFTVAVALWHQKRNKRSDTSFCLIRRQSNAGNIDVPSLPDSVSQEVGTNLHELRMEMNENDSDGSSIEESCTLQGCPAYINVLYGSRNPETT